MRILWVVPRYGRGIVGGAETLVRALATRCAAMGWDCEVATTCAVDHVTWADELPAGTSVEDGVRVHRFPVGPRDAAPPRRPPRRRRRRAGGLRRRAGVAVAQRLVAGPAGVPGGRRDHDLRVLAPYLFGTTLWGAQAAPERSALLPCLHDEPYAHLRIVRDVVGAVRGCLFNAPGEERLARRLYAGARRRRGGHRLRPARRPAGRPPPAALGGPRPLPRLRRAARGGQARARGGGARRSRSRASGRTRRRWC